LLLKDPGRSSSVSEPTFASASAAVIDPPPVQPKPVVTPEIVIAFFGLLCSFGTLFLGFRKDLREAQAAVVAPQKDSYQLQ
jgi:hypothetical protein